MGYCSTFRLQILESQGQNRVITVESGVSTITNGSSKGLFPSLCLTETRPSDIRCRYSYAESRNGNSRRRKQDDSL